LMSSGCSTFQSSRKMDMGPFAENTASMFADAQKVSRPMTWIYLKPYQNIPEVQQFRESAKPILNSLKAVLLYSNQLVALGSAHFPDQKKNQFLASYLQEAMKQSVVTGKISEIGMDAGDLDTVYSAIRASETFLAGIGAAGPLVNAVVATMDQKLSALQDAMLLVTRAIDERIETENADVRRNLQNLERQQNQFVREATLVYDYKLGHQAAMDTLLLEDASMKKLISAPGRTPDKVADDMQSVLDSRAAQIRVYEEQYDPEVTVYRAKQKELEDLRVAIETRIKLARGAMAVWGQSHRNLGAGIPVPPLIDVTGTVGGLISGAAKSVVP